MLKARRYAIAAGIGIFAVMAMLATAWLVVLTPPAGAQFTDTPPWAADQINWLADNAIADGYPDNTFRPDDNIARAQAAYWFGNYNRRTSIVQGEDVDPSASSTFQTTTTCPPGRRAIGGGGSTSTSNLFVTDSFPPNATSWSVRWESDDNATVDPSFLRVWVLCMPTDP